MTHLIMWSLWIAMQAAHGPDYQATTFPETKMSVTLPCPVYANDIDICEPLTKSNHREPVDVPAIQVKEKECVINPANACYQNYGSACPCGTYEDMPHWTCADPSRGLWQTEDGKHWCRKVQP